MHFVRPILVALLLLILASGHGRADGEVAAPNLEQVNTESIDNMPMPPTVESAFQEITRNSDQVDRLQTIITQKTNALADEKERYEGYKKTLDATWRTLLGMASKCVVGKDGDAQRKKLSEDSKAALRGINRMVKGDPTVYSSRLDDDLKELCNPQPKLGFLSDDQIRQAFEQMDGQRARWVQAAQAEIDNARKLKDARSKLRARLEAQLTELKSSADKTVNFVSDLKWLVMILGVLSVMVMFIIRTFERDVQTEWVASGQVIQFMTVLIILITILALGITGVLKENTLGTLLGGIGGYVLSQGIGRAAARTAENIANQKQQLVRQAEAAAPSSASQGGAPHGNAKTDSGRSH